MPLVLIDGPEAAGKTTIIEALMERWGPNTQFRGWGPRQSWLEYCQPLFDDIQSCNEDPKLLIVWSRSWLSRAVYNTLLEQGQSVPKPVVKELDRIVLASGGLLFLVVSPINVLLTRRLERLAQPGSKPDHPLDPEKELTEFYQQNVSRKWKPMSGVNTPNDNVSHIIDQLIYKNPEIRMDESLEDAFSHTH